MHTFVQIEQQPQKSFNKNRKRETEAVMATAIDKIQIKLRFKQNDQIQQEAKKNIEILFSSRCHQLVA